MPAPIAPSPTAQPPLPVPPRKGNVAGFVWVICLLGLLLIALVGYFLLFLGPVASVVGMVLALIPLVIVFTAVWIIDRWEPEPIGLVILALCWGGIAAVGLTLLVDLVLELVFRPAPSFAQEVLSTVVQAPVVEEIMKGLGLLIIFFTARRALDGPVDGVVYGALLGAGFAFTENIQYFAVALLDGGVAQTTVTFFMRGIVSPFAPVMFTAVTGYLLGRAAGEGAAGGSVPGHWALGLLGSIFLHAQWIGSASLGDFFLLYAVVQVPLFALFIVGIVMLHREEARLTRKRLGDYAAAGWFTPQEADMLATPAGRRAALAWARTLRGDRTATMKGFIKDATALAMTRQRALSGRDPRAAEDERGYLEAATAKRAALFAP